MSTSDGSSSDEFEKTLILQYNVNKMFGMRRPIFDCLHETLVDNYELKSTMGISSIKSLAIFLWTVGGPQSVSQVENRFQRSTETIVRKFNHVLDCLNILGANNMKPKDQQFTIVHPRLQESHVSPHFCGVIGAIGGTHIPVIVPSSVTIIHFWSVSSYNPKCNGCV
jgi:hypothetical protein